jgi:hypothetical protein
MHLKAAPAMPALITDRGIAGYRNSGFELQVTKPDLGQVRPALSAACALNA